MGNHWFLSSPYESLRALSHINRIIGTVSLIKTPYAASRCLSLAHACMLWEVLCSALMKIRFLRRYQSVYRSGWRRIMRQQWRNCQRSMHSSFTTSTDAVSASDRRYSHSICITRWWKLMTRYSERSKRTHVSRSCASDKLPVRSCITECLQGTHVINIPTWTKRDIKHFTNSRKGRLHVETMHNIYIALIKGSTTRRFTHFPTCCLTSVVRCHEITLCCSSEVFSTCANHNRCDSGHQMPCAVRRQTF